MWKEFFTPSMTMHSELPLPEKRWGRSYNRDLAIVLAAYLPILAASLIVVDDLDGVLRYVVSGAPILPFAAIGWAMLRSLKRVDERERTLIYRSLTFAFFGTAVLTFGYGFMENAGAPRLSMFSVWPVMGTMWLVGRFVAPRLP
jgi:hypothetical protein